VRATWPAPHHRRTSCTQAADKWRSGRQLVRDHRDCECEAGEVQTAHEARYRQGRGHEPSHSVHAEFVSSCPGDGFPTLPGPTRVSTSTARFRTESGPFRRRRPPWAPEHRESRAATAILSGLPRLTGIPARRDPEMPPARTPCMTVAAPSGPSQPFADASRGRPASHVPADNPERHRAHHGPVPA
jgi:hypothetical protein